MNHNRVKVYGSLILAMMCWSLSFVWIKVVYQYLGPIATTFLRLLISMVLLLIITSAIGRLKKVKKEDRWLFFLLAFFEPFLYFLGESFGMKYLSSTVGAVIVATIPLITPIAAYYVVKERMSVANIFGLFISFAGVGIIVLTKNFNFAVSPRGLLFMSLAVVAATGSSMLLKILSEKYNPLTMITYQNTIGTFLFLPLFLMFDFQNFLVAEKPRELYISLIELAVFGSSLSFIFFTYGIRAIGISKANVFANMIPVFTLFFSYFILKEEITQSKIIGISVVIGGLLLSQLKSKPRTPRLRWHR